MFRAVASTAATNLLVQVLGVVSGILLARMLGPHGRGELAIVLLWPAIIGAVCLFGTESEISRRGSVDSTPDRRLSTAAVWIALIYGSTAVAAGVLMLPWLLPGDKRYLVGLATIAMMVVPATMLNTLLYMLELGRAQYDLYSKTRLGFAVLYIGLLLGIYFFIQPTVSVVIGAYVAATVLWAGVTLIVAHWGREQASPRVTIAESATVMTTALPFAGSTIIQIAFNQLPQILLVALTDTRAVGLYAVALAVSSAHGSFGNAMAKVSFANTARAAAGGSMGWFAGQYRFLIIIYLLISLLMMALGPPLVPLIFGEGFRESAALLFWLIPATTLAALTQVLDHALRGTSVVSVGIRARVTSGAVLVVLALILAPRFGVDGIVVAVLAANCLEFAIVVLLTTGKLGVSCSELLWMRRTDFELLLENTKAAAAQGWKRRSGKRD
jgi:O-antigen/teichoic acid export membrane protein